MNAQIRTAHAAAASEARSATDALAAWKASEADQKAAHTAELKELRAQHAAALRKAQASTSSEPVVGGGAETTTSAPASVPTESAAAAAAATACAAEAVEVESASTWRLENKRRFGEESSKPAPEEDKGLSLRDALKRVDILQAAAAQQTSRKVAESQKAAQEELKRVKAEHQNLLEDMVTVHSTHMAAKSEELDAATTSLKEALEAAATMEKSRSTLEAEKQVVMAELTQITKAMARAEAAHATELKALRQANLSLGDQLRNAGRVSSAAEQLELHAAELQRVSTAAAAERAAHTEEAREVRAFNLYVNLSHAWFLNYG